METPEVDHVTSSFEGYNAHRVAHKLPLHLQCKCCGVGLGEVVHHILGEKRPNSRQRVIASGCTERCARALAAQRVLEGS